MITQRFMPRVLGVALVLAAGWLTGCATVTTIDSEVKSFAASPLPGSGAFRFERLPSQQDKPEMAAKLEGWVLPALNAAGFTRDEVKAKYSVQLSAYSMLEPGNAVQMPWPYFSYFYPGPDRVILHRGRLISVGPSFYGAVMVPDNRTHVSSLSLVVRELATGTVVYETSAVNEQRWSEPERVFPALAMAALQGYPAANAEKRKVSITSGKP